MIITKINNMHLLGVINNMQKVFRTASNFSPFNGILHSGDAKIKKTYKKAAAAEEVERFEKVNPATKPNADEVDFSDKLIKWAIQNNISFIAFSKLLKVLSESGIEGLPKNAKTLLKAKEEEISVLNVAPGTYIHFGLEKNLRNLITNLRNKNLFGGTNVDVSIFIDHLPLSKLTPRGLWVILGSVDGFPKNIFFVGAYQGYSRPKNPNLFLSEFVPEAKELCTGGLAVNGAVYNVRIKRLICDAPAKGFVLNIKHFGGYSSCTKCKTVGQYDGKTICFPEKSTPRTDEDFRSDEMYNGPKTDLLEIPDFGVVSNVTLDYMHLVCLGVVKKILSSWMIQGNYSPPVNTSFLRRLALCHPCEFSKGLKPLNLYARWSGNDFRNFLLYYGPVVLRKSLQKEYLDHFILLHVACRLLCIEATPENVDRSRKLLDSFVENYKKLYKTESITHNFHGLYHLADECISHGTLDGFSAFPFENFLLQLRNCMKKSKKKSIPHIVLRESYESVFARNLAKLTGDRYKVRKKFKTVEDGQLSHFESLKVGNFEIIPGSEGDGYVLLKDSKIIQVSAVLERKKKSQKTHLIAGREFSGVSSFHPEPFDKLKLHMFVVGGLSEVTQTWPVAVIDRKCMKIPTGNGETVMVGLLDQNF